MTHPLEQWLSDRKQQGAPVRRYELARSVGCSPSRITQIADGDQPSLALAAKLSEKTGIPIEKFIREEA